MRKKILSGLFALALLAATGYGVIENQRSEANLSDLALRNVEALAQSESGNRPYQSQAYCTMWRLENACSSTGTYACTDDC
ncbi:NVEALA domain-containing protein [Proteiniphilum acetatigenes]|uniref:NVEALA domain-containing protein n=1 Tax=Proteiniphilum acetatigenes TaxID=294710 RepID=UPI00037017F2|nr:NVEALA domain-containing protein [Proteiniphilum acetatigenes]SFL51819.1 NVEALA protein [Porphyromonadaceae bacterium KH3CP3RA]